MIYSTSSLLAQENYGSADYFLKHQLMGLALGLIGLLIAMQINLNWIQKQAKWIYIFGIIFVGLVYIPQFRHSVGGAKRWVHILGFNFQPSEFLKYAVLIYISDWVSRHIVLAKKFTYGILLPLALVGPPIILVLLQPDLGSSVAMALVVAIIIFVAGARITYLIGLVSLALPGLMWAVMGVQYRRARILAFLDPWKDPQGSGFQLIQSFIALGSGGWTGMGLGQSRQKMYYLPEAHTDFIFSIIGEEFGYIGALLVIIAFICLFYYGFKIASEASTPFGHLLGVGIISMMAVQCLINIAVVTGSMPTKGMPLPFISYGNSNLTMNMIGVGLLLNIAQFKNAKKDKKTISTQKKYYPVRW